MNTEFKYNLTEDDFIQSNLDYLKIAPNFVKQMRTIKWGFTIILLLLIVILFKEEIGFPAAFGLGGLVGVAFYFISDHLNTAMIKRKVRNTIRKGEVTLYDNGLTMVVGETSIIIKGKKDKPKYMWKDVDLVVNAPRHIYIFGTNGTAEVLPKINQDMNLIQKEIIDRAVQKNVKIKNI